MSSRIASRREIFFAPRPARRQYFNSARAELKGAQTAAAPAHLRAPCYFYAVPGEGVRMRSALRSILFLSLTSSPCPWCLSPAPPARRRRRPRRRSTRCISDIGPGVTGGRIHDVVMDRRIRPCVRGLSGRRRVKSTNKGITEDIFASSPTTRLARWRFRVTRTSCGREASRTIGKFVWGGEPLDERRRYVDVPRLAQHPIDRPRGARSRQRQRGASPPSATCGPRAPTAACSRPRMPAGRGPKFFTLMSTAPPTS